MSTKPPSRDPAMTLEDVVQAISAMEHLSRQRRQDLCSAVRRIATLQGRRPADIPADVEVIRRQIALFTPVAAGVTPRRWKNVRSLVGIALNLAGATVIRRRAVALSPAWRDLLGRLRERRERDRLSRFAGYCSSNDIPPDQVDDAVVDRFASLLLKSSLIERPKQVHRNVCLTWNRAADAVPGWPAGRLAVPDNRRHHALPLSAYPATFGADLEGWLNHRAGTDLFSETGRNPASPSTLQGDRRLLLQLAAALVRSGREPASITCLADLVAIDAAQSALKVLWDRAGGRKTGHLHNHGLLLVKLAKHWVRVPEAHLQRLRAMCKQVDPGQSGMTERNRARLRQFDDDTNIARLINLPESIARSLPTNGPLTYQQAILMQSAVAIAILLVAPIRVKNLAALTLDRHIVRSGPGGVRHLVIPAHEVKNNVPLEFEVPQHVRTLLDIYIQRCRPLLTREASGFLFPARQGPARQGGSKAPGHFGEQIQRTVARYAGLDMNVHAFRHFSAMLYLRQCPGEYETVRLLLGHKSLATTVRAYCGTEQKDALRRYDNLIDRYRQKGEARHAA